MIKVSETRSALRRMALTKVADAFGAPVGSLRSNWNAAKDWFRGRAPGHSSGVGVDASQVIRNNNVVHDSVIAHPLSFVDNVHGRYNEWQQNRAIAKNPNMNAAGIRAVEKQYPQPYGTSLNGEYLGFGSRAGSTYNKVIQDRARYAGPQFQNRAPAARIPAGGVGTGAFSFPQSRLNNGQLGAAGRSLGVKAPANPLAAGVA